MNDTEDLDWPSFASTSSVSFTSLISRHGYAPTFIIAKGEAVFTLMYPIGSEFAVAATCGLKHILNSPERGAGA